MCNLNNPLSFLFQGRIACCNVLSDIYAMGVTECDSMLMLLGISQKMSNLERDVAIKLMINGFKVSEGVFMFICIKNVLRICFRASAYSVYFLFRSWSKLNKLIFDKRFTCVFLKTTLRHLPFEVHVLWISFENAIFLPNYSLLFKILAQLVMLILILSKGWHWLTCLLMDNLCRTLWQGTNYFYYVEW